MVMAGDLFDEFDGGIDVEHAGLQGDQHLVCLLQDFFKFAAMKARWCIQHHVCGASWWSRHILGIHVP